MEKGFKHLNDHNSIYSNLMSSILKAPALVVQRLSPGFDISIRLRKPPGLCYLPVIIFKGSFHLPHEELGGG